MKGYYLGRWFGFPLTVDSSALLVLLFFALVGAKGGAASAGFGALMALSVFASVLIHELGHAFVARALGLGPIAITLHGFGGLTRFGRPPRPRQGLLVTLAGPLAGFLLGGAAWLALPHVGHPLATALVSSVATFNLFWSAFNLLPMYPLDGGILAFHGFSLVRSPPVALQWAARVGVLVAVGVGTVAVLEGEVFIGFVALSALLRSVPLAKA